MPLPAIPGIGTRHHPQRPLHRRKPHDATTLSQQTSHRLLAMPEGGYRSLTPAISRTGTPPNIQQCRWTEFQTSHLREKREGRKKESYNNKVHLQELHQYLRFHAGNLSRWWGIHKAHPQPFRPNKLQGRVEIGPRPSGLADALARNILALPTCSGDKAQQ